MSLGLDLFNSRAFSLSADATSPKLSQFKASRLSKVLPGILRISRTGSLWRDLPPEYGKWNTAFRRYREWVKADVFARIFDAVSGDPDMESAMIYLCAAVINPR